MEFLENLTVKDYFKISQITNIEALHKKLELLPYPETIWIGDIRYPTPATLDDITFGQKIGLQNMKCETDYEIVLNTLGLVFQPIVQGVNFDLVAVEKFTQSLLNCKIVEAYPVALFFCRNLQGFNRWRKKNLLIHQRKRKLLPIVITWKNLVIGLLWIWSLKCIGKLTKKYMK